MRYHEIISENFVVNHRIIGYHATHQPQGLILTDRQDIKNQDSMGTWLSSSREMVTWAFGPNVEAYELPKGKYLQARQNQSVEVLMTCLPIIDDVFDDGDEMAEHLGKWPLTPENRRFLRSMRMTARAQEKKALDRGALSYDHRTALRYRAPDQLARWKALEKSEEYHRQIARSPEYCQRFHDFMVQHGYKGIAWVGTTGWDGWKKAVNIYLIFDHDDLHPVQDAPEQKPTGYQPDTWPLTYMRE
jgi:hypothetical protein